MEHVIDHPNHPPNQVLPLILKLWGHLHGVDAGGVAALAGCGLPQHTNPVACLSTILRTATKQMRPNPVPVRLTQAQLHWLESQTQGGSMPRNAVIRLCIEAAMKRGDILAPVQVQNSDQAEA